mmetsp:Transcript_89693/g.231523  ORF Transcript_89693/g.231523 Transcript_89693/m.231523 type:complete len:202 (-) Transcript_89693:32-637(-)
MRRRWSRQNAPGDCSWTHASREPNGMPHGLTTTQNARSVGGTCSSIRSRSKPRLWANTQGRQKSSSADQPSTRGLSSPSSVRSLCISSRRSSKSCRNRSANSVLWAPSKVRMCRCGVGSSRTRCRTRAMASFCASNVLQAAACCATSVPLSLTPIRRRYSSAAASSAKARLHLGACQPCPQATRPPPRASISRTRRRELRR